MYRLTLLQPWIAKYHITPMAVKVTGQYTRKYLHLSILLLLGALIIPLVMLLMVVESGFVLGLAGFAFALTGSILFLVQIGEIN